MADHPTENDATVICHQNEEIARLQAQLALTMVLLPNPQTAQVIGNPPLVPDAAVRDQADHSAEQPPPGAPGPATETQRVLYTDANAAAQAQAQLVSDKGKDPTPKKVSLPDIIPSFKASALDIREFLVTNPLREMESH